MTWFETEQICRYLTGLETALDEWTLSRHQMQSIKAELIRLNNKLKHEMYGKLQRPKKELLLGLCDHIHQCQDCIDERLKY